MPKRKSHSPDFKAKVALEAIREDMTMAELSKKYGVHPTQIGTWQRAAIQNMASAFSKPSIMNSDQESQFTGFEWIQALKDADVAISMAGKGRWVDNRMIERLWRSLKYGNYLNAFETGSQVRAGIGKWLAYYDSERPHSTHGILTPDEAYERKTEPMSLAA